MSAQQVEEHAQHLEARVAALEAELTQVKHLLSDFFPHKTPWWLNVAGSFEGDPTFDEAVRLGREWRESAE